MFAKAKKFKKLGLSYKEVGEIVANISNREKPFSSSTMWAWLKHDSYNEYLAFTNQRIKESKAKRERAAEKPEINVIPFTPEDQEKADAMKKILDNNYQRYEGVIRALASITVALPVLYGPGIKLPEGLIDNLLEEVFKLDLLNQAEKSHD